MSSKITLDLDFLEPDWPAPACVKAYTTVRSSARESDDSLSDDDLKKLLSLPTSPYWLKQIHGIHAIEISSDLNYPEADACYSTKANQVCAILTADCLPILFCHQRGNLVGAIHAGWRGLANGIIENTFSLLPVTHQNDCIVWLGPAISPLHFEVGHDVYSIFTTLDPATAQYFRPQNSGKWLADLYALARFRLMKLGIQQIYGGEYCTYADKDLFYSYRRDKGKTGRMASLIWFGQA